VLLRLPEGAVVPDAAPAPVEVEDAWILSRLQAAKAEVARAIDGFEFHHAVLTLYAFVYDELCDWYLELVKPRLYAEDDGATAAVALHVLAETLALAHPVIPFVTEEIWDHVPVAERSGPERRAGGGGLLMARRWPEPDAALADPAAEAEVARAIAAVQELRGWRDRVGAPAGATVPARLDAPGFERTRAHVARLARVEWREERDGGEPVGTVGVPGGAVVILASEAVDAEAEARRARERQDHLRREIARAEGRLANRGFVAKAPEDVVAGERDKLERLRRELADLPG
jgi:valyl-tRNA synthetase